MDMPVQQNTYVSDVASLNAVIARAEPGDQVIYYVGSLAYDRMIAFGEHTLAINSLADAAMQIYRAGKAHLVQRRTGRVITETSNGKVYEFQYIAVRR